VIFKKKKKGKAKKKDRRKQRSKRKNRGIFFEDIFFVFSSMLILVGAMGIAYSAYLYMIGFHNMDLSYNMALISNDVNLMMNDTVMDYRSLRDQYDFGKFAPYSSFYIGAAHTMPKVLYFIIMSSLIFMLGLFGSITLYDRARYRRK
jgi:hypothetical protein